MNRDDLVLAKLVVEKGWLTEKDVDAAVQEQMGTEDGEETVGRRSPRPLGVLLVAKKLITDDQLIRLMDEVKERGGTTKKVTEPPPGPRLGEILVRQGKLTERQLEGALQEQQAARREGRILRLGEILIEKGYVRPRHVAKALKEQNKTVVACIGCGLRYNVVNYKAWIEYRCKQCGSLLDLAHEMLSADETTIGLKPFRDAPRDVQDASGKQGAHFGKFIIVKEMVRGEFGTLFRSWKKDEQTYVGLVFIDKRVDSAELARLFSKVQATARDIGSSVTRMIEVGEHKGRRYLCVSLS